jgi:OmpA-OmpF porin, OOP family
MLGFLVPAPKMLRIPTLALLISVAITGYSQVPNLNQINGGWDEQGPVLSPDGTQLFFTVASNASNIGGMRDHGDIWFSTLTESGWGAPVHAGKNINNTLHNVVAGFSADGKKMYLMSHYSVDGNPVTTQGISVSERTQQGWSHPQNIRIPYFKNRSAYQSGYISQDGTVLVYSADSYESKGAEDIYVSLFVGGKWSEPVNLGPVINTTEQDVCPSLSADKQRLYFASNGHLGLGSFDIFYSDRLDETWKNWSPPANLGAEINSEGRELYYRESRGMAFCTTTQNSDGYADIRFHRRPVDSTNVVAVVAVMPPPIDSVKAEKILPKIDSSASYTTISGHVVNSKTNEIIPGGSIQFHSGEKLENITADSKGNYQINLQGKTEYHVKVEAKGFIGRFEKLDLSKHPARDLVLNFSLQPIEVGTTVNLKSVLFVQSKPVLLDESFDELDMVVDFMKLNPNVSIQLSGHTDNRGRHDMNMKLSRERVDAVKAYLVSKGVESRRISGQGYGGTRPIADNEAEETRALNRRVEFTIMKD